MMSSIKKHRTWILFFGLLGIGMSIHAPIHAQEVAKSAFREKGAEHWASTIRELDTRKHLSVLTSDSLEGRESGQAGQKRAARYIAGAFKRLGLVPVVRMGAGPSYFQKFYLRKEVNEEVYIRVRHKRYVHLKDMLYFGHASIPEEKTVSLVMAGGEGAMEGKLVAYVGSSVDEWRKVASLARKQKALGVVIFVDQGYADFKKEAKTYMPYLTSRYVFAGIGNSTNDEIAVVLPSRAFRSFFGVSFARSEEVKGKEVQVSFKVKKDGKDVITENVLGYMEGSDKKEELLVITGHYDHLGSHGKEIYHGADDNASGTSAILELAEAFSLAKAAGEGPRRSLLFMLFTAEEKGLLGSDFYARNPVFPLSQTVANLNIDMVGRVDALHKENADYVYLIGSDRLSQDLHDLSERVNRTYSGLSLDYTYNALDDPNRFYYRSDHYNFAKHNIPIIFYFNGTHADYHKPTDTVDKIVFEALTKRARLVFFTAWEIVHRDARIRLNE